jgi:hypothetical protein
LDRQRVEVKSLMIAALALLGLAAAAAPRAELYSFGRLTEHLTPADLSAIASLATEKGGAPWALYGWTSQVLPETWYVDVFLPPFLSTSRLKRGRVVQFRCAPVSKVCQQWEFVDADTEYAQVAVDPTGLPDHMRVRRPLERPIRVTGKFTDRELTTLVEYIRTSPSPPTEPGWQTSPVSGAIPILDIIRMPDETARVVLTQTGNPGETATVVQTNDGWQLLRLVMWVA